MSEASAFGSSRVGLSKRLRDWAGESVLRRVLVVLLQLGPVLLAAGSLPLAIDGSLAARVVVGLVVVLAVAYRVVDTRLALKDDPSRGMA